jgi:PadR family transcriptional regulator, regulatory protein AphA
VSLEHILLGLLRTPASGYDLRAAFQQSVRHIWSAELSQIYPALDRMTRRGWLRRTQAPSKRGPPRRLYSITAEGRKELRRWLDCGPIMGTERFAYLAQLYFMDELGDPAKSLRFITRLREALAAWRQQLKTIDTEFLRSSRGLGGFSDEELHQYLTLRMGMHALSAKMAWCDESLQRLRRRTKRTRGRRP